MKTAVSFWQGSGHPVTMYIDHPVATPGVGVHQLSWPVYPSAPWLKDGDHPTMMPLQLSGRVWLDAPEYRFIGELHVKTVKLLHFQTNENISINLSTDQLRILERVRGEQGISFRFDLEALLIGAPEPASLDQSQATLFTPETAWREASDRLGAEVDVVLRVRSPLTEADRLVLSDSQHDGVSFQQAVDRLRRARAELTDHQYEHCVGTCRGVVEILRGLSSVESEKAIYNVNAQERTQEQRWGWLVQGLFGLTSASHHVKGVATQFTWTRAEAEAVLGCTAAMLMRYQETHRSN